MDPMQSTQPQNNQAFNAYPRPRNNAEADMPVALPLPNHAPAIYPRPRNDAEGDKTVGCSVCCRYATRFDLGTP